jgi:LPXTG-motif cell wall-anchored protein
MKQAQIYVVMIVFICSYLLTPFQYLGQASAADNHITAEANKYVTDVKLYSQYEDGPQTEFDVFESVSVAYKWAVADNEKIASGDQMVFQLPQQLNIADGTDEFNVTVSEQDPTVIGVATVDRTNKTVTITFNNYFESHPKDKSGTLAFWTNWNWQQQNVVNINDINNLDFGKATIPVNVVNYGPDKDEKIGKYGWIDPDTGSIEWRVRINFAKENLQNVVYEDILGAGQTLDGTVKVQYGYFEDDLHSTFKPVSHTPATVENTATGFKVAFGDLNGLSAYITYKTKPVGEMKAEYENSGRLTAQGKNIATQTVWTPKSGGSATGSGQQTASFVVMKNWDDNNNVAGKRPESITVALYQNGQKTNQTVTLSDANDWFAMFTGLEKYKSNGEPHQYSIKEVNVPAGYEQKVDGNTITNIYIDTTPKTTVVEGQKKWDDNDNAAGDRPTSVNIQLLQNGKAYDTTTASADNDWQYRFTDLPVNDDKGQAYTYTVKEVDVPKGYISTVKGFDITNKYTPETTTVSGKKIWSDANNEDGTRPESIVVNLLVNGQKIDETTVTAADNWTYSFKDLPKYEQGQAVKYTVTEQPVAGYMTTIDGYDITNTYTPSKTNFTATKVWLDANNQDGKRPASINVQLYNGNEKVGEEVVLSASNDWTYTWTDLAEKVGGQQASYTVKEVNVPIGYTSKVEGGTITNSYTPATTHVAGTKTWDDANDQDGMRPKSIRVNLVADGEIVDTKTVTAKDNWAYSFNNLPKYKDGEAIDYSVTEDAVDHYTTEVNGYDITNHYAPGKTSFTVTKAWDDANDQDGKRPDTIDVQLFAGTEKVGEEVTLSAASNWTYTWTDLALKANGQAINYTVKEVNTPDGYKAKVDGNTITNSYVPATTSIQGTKTWLDANDQDGKRPERINVNLLANGQKVDETMVTAEDNWTYSFTDLPKYKDGEAIQYTVAEHAIDHYTTTIDGYNITNSYTPGKTSFTVTKAWLDANDQDGKRPDTIDVQLFAGTEKVGEEVTLSAASNWTYTWTDLALKASGKQIAYTVQEVNVPKAYEVTTTEIGANNVQITNSYTPATTSVAGKKTWKDADDQDGKRPEAITVNLLANGEKVHEAIVTSEDNWAYNFNNLPVYDNGQKISYTVEEMPVEGYTSIVKGYNITNHYTPQLTSVEGTKTWVDGNNQDGKRPESIVVELFNGKTKVAAQTVTAATNWHYAFTDLPKYENGNIINYTVKEQVVAGYETTINGYNITNTYTPATTSVAGTKTWNDANNQDGKRPESITVNLLADGKKVAQRVVTEKDNWAYGFTNLPKYNAGQPIVYTVTEDAVMNYATAINGYDITNSYTPGKTSFTVTKVWDDANDQDGKRPDTISVQLYANGQPIGGVVNVTAANNWTYTWTELAQKANGLDVVYTVKEVNVPTGYTSTVTGGVMTNTYTPETTTVDVVKVWDDAGHEAARPASITVNLFADGQHVSTQQLTADDNWTYSFTNLPKYNAGQAIVYTITEEAVSSYKTDIDGFTITNHYVKTVVEENPPHETPNTPEETPTTPEETPETPEEQPTLPEKPAQPTSPTERPSTSVTTPQVTTTAVNPPRQSAPSVTTTPATTVVPASTTTIVPAHTTYQAAPEAVQKQVSLPQTGDRTTMLMLTGFALLLSTIALLIVRKRRMN